MRIKRIPVTAATPAQRKQAQRERIREAGFKLVQVVVHPDDELRLHRLVSRMNKQRGLGK